MKLARRLILTVLAGVMVLIALDGYIAMQRSVRRFDQEMERHALMLGRALAPVVTEALRSGGESRAREILATADHGNPGITVSLVIGLERLDRLGTERTSDLRRGMSVSLVDDGDGGTDTRRTLVPIRADSGWIGAIHVSESVEALSRYRAEAAIRTVGLVVLTGLLGALTIRGLGVRLVGRPLDLLAAQARRVGRGELNTPLYLHGPGELSELANAMNGMCEDLSRARDEISDTNDARLRALAQARHRDRLHAIGEVAAGIAHELGTPLNVITGRAAMIVGEDLPRPQVEEFALVIREQAARMDSIVKDLLRYGRRRSPGKERTDLGVLVRSTVDVLEPFARQEDVELVLTTEPVCELEVDPAQIQQVVTNLVINAVHASERGTRVEVLVDRPADASPDPNWASGAVRLRVKDYGKGMTPEVQGRMLDPFYTTKKSGEGTGLGLSIAHGILVDHGARLDVTSCVGCGSEFVVLFPVDPDV